MTTKKILFSTLTSLLFATLSGQIPKRAMTSFDFQIGIGMSDMRQVKSNFPREYEARPSQLYQICMTMPASTRFDVSFDVGFVMKSADEISYNQETPFGPPRKYVDLQGGKLGQVSIMTTYYLIRKWTIGLGPEFGAFNLLRYDVSVAGQIGYLVHDRIMLGIRASHNLNGYNSWFGVANEKNYLVYQHVFLKVKLL
jgi:hypothetical protein